jgi:hypothetical protein
MRAIRVELARSILNPAPDPLGLNHFGGFADVQSIFSFQLDGAALCGIRKSRSEQF